MAFAGPLKDRLLIRELVGAFADAVFRKDEADYLACWAAEGARITNGEEIRGTAALRARWRECWLVVEQIASFTEIGAMRIDGDRATMRSYLRETIRLRDGACWSTIGAYEDVVVRQDERWRFASREYWLVLREAAHARAEPPG